MDEMQVTGGTPEKGLRARLLTAPFCVSAKAKTDVHQRCCNVAMSRSNNSRPTPTRRASFATSMAISATPFIDEETCATASFLPNLAVAQQPRLAT
jgi:hypothetical protein